MHSLREIDNTSTDSSEREKEENVDRVLRATRSLARAAELHHHFYSVSADINEFAFTARGGPIPI